MALTSRSDPSFSEANAESPRSGSSLLPSRSGLTGLLARASGAAFLLQAAGVGLSFCLHVLLARVLGAANYGVYVYALTWVGMLGLMCTAGLDTAALRFASQYAGTADWGRLRGFIQRTIKTVLATSLGVAVVFVLGIVVLRGAMTRQLEVVMAASALLLPVNALEQLLSSILQGLKRVVLAQSPNVVLRPIVLAAAVLFALWFTGRAPGPLGTVLLSLAAGGLVVALSAVLLKRCRPREVGSAVAIYETRTWLAVAVPLLFMTGVNVVIARSDVLMIGMFLGTTDAGIYRTASRLAGFAAFGLSAANVIVAPLIAELYARGEKARLQKMVRQAALGVALFSGLALLGLLVLGRTMLGLFGATFRAGYVPMLVLVVGQTISSVAGSVGFLMTMTGHEKTALKVVASAAAVNVLLNALLIPRLGMTGAAIATAVAVGGWNLVLVVLVRRRLGINPTCLPLRV